MLSLSPSVYSPYMKLNDIQFARTAAFVLGLRLIGEKLAPDVQLSRQAVDALQDFTVERSNQLAVELDVSFPDENERETVAIFDAPEIDEDADENALAALADAAMTSQMEHDADEILEIHEALSEE